MYLFILVQVQIGCFHCYCRLNCTCFDLVAAPALSLYITRLTRLLSRMPIYSKKCSMFWSQSRISSMSTHSLNMAISILTLCSSTPWFLAFPKCQYSFISSKLDYSLEFKSICCGGWRTGCRGSMGCQRIWLFTKSGGATSPAPLW